MKTTVGCWCLGMFCIFALAISSRVADAQGTEWDIYLLAGQSNAVGWETNFADLPLALQGPQTDVRLFSGPDGMLGNLAPGSGNRARAFGAEITFGRTLADANPGRNIAIVKHAVGGSVIASWNPNSDPDSDNNYDDLLSTLDAAKSAFTAAGDTFNVRGALWYQGESDATALRVAAYEANLTNLVSNLREDVGVSDLQVAVAQLAQFNSPTREAEWAVVQSAQARVAALDSNINLVGTADLFPLSDNVHLSSGSQEILGARFAQAIQGQLDQLQITNASFEVRNDLGDGVSDADVASGWIKSDGDIAIENPDGSSYSNQSVIDGTNALVVQSGESAEQSLASVVESGNLYTLTAAIGDRDSASFAGARIELLADGVVLADSGNILSSLGAGTFTDLSFDYLAQPGDAGVLGIRLVSLDGGGVADFDNVRITAASVPEPSSLILLGIGGAFLATRRSRKIVPLKA